MATSVELRQKRAALIEEAKGILTRAESENRSLLGDEESRWQEAMRDAEELMERIERIEKQDKLDAEVRELIDRNREERIEIPRVSEKELEERAFSKFLRGQEAKMTAEERALAEKRAQSTTDSEGGYLVPEGFAGYVTSAMRAFGGMLQSRATVINTASGNELPFPLNDETGKTGSQLAENAEASEDDLSFTEIRLGAYTYSSGLVKVSYQLLQDEAVGFESYLGSALGTRLGRKLNTDLTVGDGSSKPRGIFTAAPTGKTAASATAITSDEVFDLIYSLDPAYLAGAEFMMSFPTEGHIRKLKDGSGAYVWQPGLQAGQPDRLAGYPIVRNQDAPAIATGKSPILFGDMSAYVIRSVSGVRLIRFNERFATALQVGWLGWQRFDGDLVAANTSTYCPVKKLTMS